jgi:hypothetical protein
VHLEKHVQTIIEHQNVHDDQFVLMERLVRVQMTQMVIQILVLVMIELRLVLGDSGEIVKEKLLQF